LFRKKKGEREAKGGTSRKIDQKRKGYRTKRNREKERKKDTKSKRKNNKQEKGEVKVATH